MIDFAYPADALPPKTAAEALDQLTGALLRNEGAADNSYTRAMSWGLLHPMPLGTVNVGGRPAKLPVYRVIATVPAGTMLHGPGPLGVSSRQSLVREMTDIIRAAEGTEPDELNSLRVMVLIQEIADGSWGGLGTTFTMTDIAAVADETLPQTETSRAARSALARAEHEVPELVPGVFGVAGR
jgi:hypothetical protein